jgi:hypothetical protein
MKLTFLAKQSEDDNKDYEFKKKNSFKK